MMTATEAAVAQAAVLLGRARSAIAFTGAGVSVESGIPHFRGEGGLWTQTPSYHWEQSPPGSAVSYVTEPLGENTTVIGGG